MATVETTRTPWHLWAVGIVSLLWNAFGAYDYLMSVSRNADYLADFPPEMVSLLESFPVWVNAAWAIGIWGSVAGAVLLLLRSRWAATAFLVSLAGSLVSFAYQFTLDMPAGLSGGMYTIMPIVIMVLIVAQWLYARRMAAAGVLR